MITVKGLHKYFQSFHALKGIDLHVRKGEIYGFIGKNGAGKSTAMNILAGLSRPSQGQCLVNGLDAARLRHPGDLRLGFLPEDPKFYPWMTARETLSYLSGGANPGRVWEILQWTGLAEASDRRVGGFSRGMRQRLGIGAALLRNPALFLLDEPSSALDPQGRSDVLRLIRDLKGMGKTVLFSTHILDDVERVCDTIGMISAGRMIFEKPLAQLQREHAQPVYDITPAAALDAFALDALKQLRGVVSVTESAGSLSVRVADGLFPGQLLRFLADLKAPVESFALRKARLEDLFLQEANENEG